MDIIFINSTNTGTSDHHRQVPNYTDKKPKGA